MICLSPSHSAAKSRGKVVVVGEYNSGKTSLVRRFVAGDFSHVSEPTIAAAFQSKGISIRMPDTGAEYNVKLELWDTAGSERYKSLMPMYYRDAAAAIVVYDVTSPQSLAKVPQWVAALREQAGGESCFVALVGAKDDLRTVGPSQRSVDPDEARAMAATLGPAECFVTSARLNSGVMECFARVAAEVVSCEHRREQMLITQPRIDDEPRVIDLDGRKKTQKTGGKVACCAGAARSLPTSK